MVKLEYLKRETNSREKVFEKILGGSAVLVNTEENLYLGFVYNRSEANWVLLSKPTQDGTQEEATKITREQALAYIDDYVSVSNNITNLVNTEIEWAQSTLPEDEDTPSDSEHWDGQVSGETCQREENVCSEAEIAHDTNKVD